MKLTPEAPKPAPQNVNDPRNLPIPFAPEKDAILHFDWNSHWLPQD